MHRNALYCREEQRTDIAKGMVDERVVVEGLSDSTTLITLTSEEAHKYLIADTVLSGFNELLSAFDLKILRKMNHIKLGQYGNFLNNPIISSILIMIGFFGLMVEIIKSTGLNARVAG